MNHKPNSVPNTIPEYLGSIFHSLKLNSIFAVPGDFNLKLLSGLEKYDAEKLKSNELQRGYELVYGCNELNSGYSADGYARIHGLSALIVTYSVGSLSTLNSVAGMYCEHLPCLVISGGPNTNSKIDSEIVHHTLGEKLDYDYAKRCMEQVTVKQVVIDRAQDAPHLLHEAIIACISNQRPVYIQIACNILSDPIVPEQLLTAELASSNNFPYFPSLSCNWNEYFSSSGETKELLLNRLSALLKQSRAPLVVIGGLAKLCFHRDNSLRPQVESFLQLNDIPFVCLPDAKGLLSETHPNYLGLAFGIASLPCSTQKVLESSDLLICLGAICSDYSTAGYTLALPEDKSILIFEHYSKAHGLTYPNVNMVEFLQDLVKLKDLNSNQFRLTKQYKKQIDAELNLLLGFKEEKIEDIDKEFQKQYSKYIDSVISRNEEKLNQQVKDKINTLLENFPLNANPGSKLTVQSLIHNLQRNLLNGVETNQQIYHLLLESGDSWFIGEKLRLLNKNSRVLIQMQYGSIGWSIGSTVGASVALKETNSASGGRPKERLVALIGDGSLQMSVQEISTLIRYQLNPIIIILNNHGYVIEELIEPGKFNKIIQR
jgi:pyruvate decarboxylase